MAIRQQFRNTIGKIFGLERQFVGKIGKLIKAKIDYYEGLGTSEG